MSEAVNNQEKPEVGVSSTGENLDEKALKLKKNLREEYRFLPEEEFEVFYEEFIVRKNFEEQFDWLRVPLILIGFAACYLILAYTNNFTYTAAAVLLVTQAVAVNWMLSSGLNHVIAIWRGTDSSSNIFNEMATRYGDRRLYDAKNLPLFFYFASEVLSYISSGHNSTPVSTTIAWVEDVFFYIALGLGFTWLVWLLSSLVAKFITYDWDKIKKSFPKRLKSAALWGLIVPVTAAIYGSFVFGVFIYISAMLAIVAFYALWFAVRLATNIVKSSRATSSS